MELLDWTAPRDTLRPGIHLGIGKTVYTMLVLTSKIRQVCAINSHLIVILEGEEAKTRLAQQLWAILGWSMPQRHSYYQYFALIPVEWSLISN